VFGGAGIWEIERAWGLLERNESIWLEDNEWEWGRRWQETNPEMREGLDHTESPQQHWGIIFFFDGTAAWTQEWDLLPLEPCPTSPHIRAIGLYPVYNQKSLKDCKQMADVMLTTERNEQTWGSWSRSHLLSAVEPCPTSPHIRAIGLYPVYNQKSLKDCKQMADVMITTERNEQTWGSWSRSHLLSAVHWLWLWVLMKRKNEA
jgi:hypothetical protein